MDAIDRRTALRNLLCGVLAAGLGASFLANPAEAVPLAMEKDLGRKADDLREKAQPVQMRRRRHPDHWRRRHWRHRHWRHRRPRRVC
jgi:hypothetical protein